MRNLTYLGYSLLVCWFAGLFAPAAAQGPEFVKEINPGKNGSFFAFRVESKEYIEINGKLIFLARHDVFGIELWYTDGTAEGTQLLKDIKPGKDSGFPGNPNFTRLGDFVYFFADDGLSGLELWRTDGTEANTQQVQDLNPGLPSSILPGRDTAYMTVYRGNLYVGGTNGTQAGLFTGSGALNQMALVKEIPSSQGLASLEVSNDQLFFSAGERLWRSDGTTNGTVPVSDNAFFGVGWSVDLNGTLLFTANDQPRSSNYELWKTDGTPEGTTKLREIKPAPLDGGVIPALGPVVLDNILYFAGEDDSSQGGGLWQSDGTPGGTRRIKEFNREAPRYFTQLGSSLIFNGHEGASGSESWIYQPGSEGAELIADLIPLDGSANPTLFITVADKTYFSASCGRESAIFETDGTAEGTFQVSGNYPNQARGAMRLNGELLFWQDNDDEQGFELWKYNTAQGPLFEPVPDINITAEGETSLCPEETLTLQATEVEGAAYIWMRGKREVARGDQPTLEVSEEGDYTVRVERSCFIRKESGDTITVDTNVLPKVPELTAPQGAVLCAGTQIPLSIEPQPGVTYVLKLDDTTLDTEVGRSFQVGAAGSYVVEATTACGAAVSNTLTVSELSSFNPEITPAGPSALCEGGGVVLETALAQDVRYRWLLEGDTLDTDQNFLVAEAVGDYTVVLEGNCGTVNSAPFRVEENVLPTRPEIATQAGASLCDGGDVILEVPEAEGLRYQWLRDESPIDEATTAQYTVTDAGIYEVEIANACGSVLSRNQIPITAEGTLASPLAEAADNCAGQSVVLTARGGAEGSYRWYDRPDATTPLDNDGLSRFTTPVLLASTSFYVATVNGTCESERVEVPVLVREELVADAGEDQTVLLGQSVNLQASGGTSVRWEPTDGLNDPGSYQPTASPPQTTTYTVTVTSDNGCTATDEVTVVVDESLDVPDAFTPNNDGVNDAWEIDGLEQFPACEVLVYNRWGVRVFQSTGYAVPWSGSVGGKALAPDTYFYKIDFNDGQQANLTGYVAIIR